MRLRLRDLIATLLVLAVVVPYVVYLFTGGLPTSIGDFGGLAFVGLLLGVPALVVQTNGDTLDRTARLEEVLAGGAVALGLVALVFSESAAAELLVAVFLVSVLMVWAVEIIDHAGLVRRHDRARAGVPSGA